MKKKALLLMSVFALSLAGAAFAQAPEKKECPKAKKECPADKKCDEKAACKAECKKADKGACKAECKEACKK